MAIVDKVIVGVGADITDFTRGIEQTLKKLRDFGKDVAAVSKSLTLSEGIAALKTLGIEAKALKDISGGLTKIAVAAGDVDKATVHLKRFGSTAQVVATEIQKTAVAATKARAATASFAGTVGNIDFDKLAGRFRDVGSGKFVGRNDAIPAMQQWIAVLKQGAGFEATRVASLAKLQAVEAGLTKTLQSGTLTLAERIKVASLAAKAQQVLTAATAATTTTTVAATTATRAATASTTALAASTSIFAGRGNRAASTAIAVGFGLESIARGGDAAEGGIRIALRSIASFTAFLGPKGFIVSGVAVSIAAIMDMFDRTKKAAEEAKKVLVALGDFGVPDLQARLSVQQQTLANLEAQRKQQELIKAAAVGPRGEVLPSFGAAQQRILQLDASIGTSRGLVEYTGRLVQAKLEADRMAKATEDARKAAEKLAAELRDMKPVTFEFLFEPVISIDKATDALFQSVTEAALKGLKITIPSMQLDVEVPDVTLSRLDTARVQLGRAASAAVTMSEGIRDAADGLRSFGNVGKLVSNFGNTVVGSLSKISGALDAFDRLADAKKAFEKGDVGSSAVKAAQVGAAAASAGAALAIGSAIFSAGQAFVALFDNAFEDDRNRLLRQNSERLEELRRGLADFRLDAGTSSDLIKNIAKLIGAGSQSILSQAFAGTTFKADVFGQISGKQIIADLNKALIPLGSSFAELKAAADELGINLVDKTGKPIQAAFAELGEAIRLSAESMVRFKNTLSDQRTIAELGANIRNVVETPAAIIKRELDLLARLAPSLGASFAGLDATTEAGRVQIKAALEALFNAFAAGTIPYEQFKGLDLQDLISIITNTEGALDSFGEAARVAEAALRNVPSGFRLAAAVFAAQLPQMPTTGTTGTIPPNWVSGPTGGGITIHGGVTIVAGDRDPEQLWDELDRVGRRRARSHGVSHPSLIP